MHTGRFTFTDWVDLDSYFRVCWVYQSSEKSDQKVEMTQREVREVLQNQMDLKTRVVGVSDKSRMLGQMVGRMIILSTVSRSGVCQSLMIQEIFLAIPTSATMLVKTELGENREKVIRELLAAEFPQTFNLLLVIFANKM